MKRLLFLALICFLGIQMGLAQADVISVKDYLKIMKDKNVVLVSARKPADYKKVHIVGAININHKDLYNNIPVKTVLKPVNEIAKILGSKGISETNKIVLYDGGTGKYSGRLYWILKYLGAPDVKILDGHISAWKALRKPVTRIPTKVKATIFHAKPNPNLIADMAYVKKVINNPHFVLVDARSPEEFNGTKESKIRKGKIPGSINLEYKHMLNTKKMLKSKDELAKLFKAKGITPDKEVILFCETSIRAGIVYLALTSVLNYPKVRVYDGAYLEWQSIATNKVK
ncbi:sulfurtransferase [Ancylomarina longa]|uniref:Sulfurtransferase n=1 Tax=Ancylomarina longa TaxID=2487017 RepID=A0A434AZL0_9BACT|nr:sulfurtransferase [Ancylomarina longa]RUT79945.1 sulfurtransferase [Ancylomarina longa]